MSKGLLRDARQLAAGQLTAISIAVDNYRPNKCIDIFELSFSSSKYFSGHLSSTLINNIVKIYWLFTILVEDY